MVAKRTIKSLIFLMPKNDKMVLILNNNIVKCNMHEAFTYYCIYLCLLQLYFGLLYFHELYHMLVYFVLDIIGYIM